MRIEQVADASEGSSRAAELFALLSSADPGAPLGLATGATMQGLYARLTTQGFRPRCSDIFLLDEYVGLAEQSPYSFAEEIRKRFSDPLGFQGHTHVPGQGPYAGPDGNARFEQILAERGPLSVQLLGIGTNGHIAFNEPGSPADSRTREVVLAQETLTANARHFPEGFVLPTRATTQGLATIAQASTLLLLAFGPSKHEALRSGLSTVSTDHPLSALVDHPGLIIITDADLGN